LLKKIIDRDRQAAHVATLQFDEPQPGIAPGVELIV
jgi:hypothetical protein